MSLHEQLAQEEGKEWLMMLLDVHLDQCKICGGLPSLLRCNFIADLCLQAKVLEADITDLVV